MVPLLSKPVLDEYRAVFGSAPLLQRYPQLSARQIDFLIERLVYLGDYVRSPKARFKYARDPLDEKFIELAIVLQATHIITSDDDLLALSDSRRDAGKRFRQRLPNVVVMEAAAFIQRTAQNWSDAAAGFPSAYQMQSHGRLRSSSTTRRICGSFGSVVFTHVDAIPLSIRAVTSSMPGVCNGSTR